MYENGRLLNHYVAIIRHKKHQKKRNLPINYARAENYVADCRNEDRTFVYKYWSEECKFNPDSAIKYDERQRQRVFARKMIYEFMISIDPIDVESRSVRRHLADRWIYD